MGIGSGLGASFGIKQEATFGTYIAPDHFYEVDSAQIKKVKNTSQGGGLAAGRMVQLGSRRVVANQSAAGPVTLEVPNKGGGLLFSHLYGSSVIVQQGATAAWLQTHTLADNVGKFFTAQSGIPDVGGTPRPYSFLGGKILAATFDCAADGQLNSTWDLDFRDVSESQSLAAPSFTAGTSPFVFNQMAVKLGTFGAEASVTGVKKVTVKVERPQNTARIYAGAAGLKAEPIMNNFIKISGTFEVDLITKADFADRVASDLPTSLVWEFINPVAIAGAFFPTFRIRIPQIFLEGDTPTIDNPDITSGSFPFTAQFDGTNVASTLEYMSTDIAI